MFRRYDDSILIIAGLVFFALGWVVSKFFPDPVLLYSSLRSPWGAVTSNFIYDGWQNALVYSILVAYALGCSAAYTLEQRAYRYRIIVISQFTGGIAASMVQLIIWYTRSQAGYSFGQSGVVYALWGSLSFFLIFGIVADSVNLFQRLRCGPRLVLGSAPGVRLWRKAVSQFFLITGFLFTFGFLLLDPSGFFSAGPGIDSGLHDLSFASGLILTSIFSLFLYRRKQTVF